MADETAKALQSMRTFLFELAEKGNEKLSGFADIRPPETSGAVDPGGDDAAPPPPPPLQRQIWELPIHAITYERSGWVAWVGTNRLEPGTQIAMSNSLSGPCGFRILSVSRYCVWAWVVLDDQDLQAKAPDIQWPDFVSVRVMQEGKVNRPVGLVMPDDRLLPLNRAVRFTRTRSSLSLERLWPRGGELTLLLADGKPLGRLICVLPAR